MAELPADAEDGWPAVSDVPYSPGGPTVLRRWVDEDAELVAPLPAGPYWALSPASLRSPLARGIVLERVGGGLLVVATVLPAAGDHVTRRLAERYGELAEIECARGFARGAESETTTDDGGTATLRVLIVDAGPRLVVVAGSLPAGTALQSREEFEAAFSAACSSTR